MGHYLLTFIALSYPTTVVDRIIHAFCQCCVTPHPVALWRVYLIFSKQAEKPQFVRRFTLFHVACGSVQLPALFIAYKIRHNRDEMGIVRWKYLVAYTVRDLQADLMSEFYYPISDVCKQCATHGQDAKVFYRIHGNTTRTERLPNNDYWQLILPRNCQRDLPAWYPHTNFSPSFDLAQIRRIEESGFSSSFVELRVKRFNC